MNPSTSSLAKLARASYTMGEKGKSKMKRMEETQDSVADTDYILNPKYSNSEISVFQLKTDPQNIVISMRGTKVGGRRGNIDLVNDLSIATGRVENESTFKRRKKKTNQIIKDLSPTTLNLTGHSLGGTTTNYTIANSNIVRKYIKSGNNFSATTFDAGAHPLYNNNITVGKGYGKILENKVNHYRTDKDVVSIGLLTNNPFGKVKTIKIKYDKKNSSNLYDQLIKGTVLGKIKQFTNETLDAHKIDHFIDD